MGRCLMPSVPDQPSHLDKRFLRPLAPLDSRVLARDAILGSALDYFESVIRPDRGACGLGLPGLAMVAPALSAVAGAACVVAAGSAFVMVRAGFAAIDATVAFDAFLDVHHADAITAGALDHVDRRTHFRVPFFAMGSRQLGSNSGKSQADFVRRAGGSRRSLVGRRCAPDCAEASD